MSALAVSPNYAVDQTVAAITSVDGQLHWSVNQGTTWTPGTLTIGVGGQHTLLFSPTLRQRSIVAGGQFERSRRISIDRRRRDVDARRCVQSLYALSWRLCRRSRSNIGISADDGEYAVCVCGNSIRFVSFAEQRRELVSGQHRPAARNGAQPRYFTGRSGALAGRHQLLRSRALRRQHGRMGWQCAAVHRLRPDVDVMLRANSIAWCKWHSRRTWRTITRRWPARASPVSTASSAAASIDRSTTARVGPRRSPRRCVDALAFSPDVAIDHTVWASSSYGPLGPGLLRSVDGGAHWSLLTASVVAEHIVPSPNYAIDHTLLAATQDGHLQKSIDGGATWTPILTHTISALAVSPAYGASQVIYAAAKDSALAPAVLYRSDDGGATWV